MSIQIQHGIQEGNQLTGKSVDGVCSAKTTCMDIYYKDGNIKP